jgi:hypothetical protein
LKRFWSRKQKRVYRKISLGIRKRRNHGLLRFLTLGTSPDFNGNVSVCFAVLKKRISRLTVNSLLVDGYISNKDARFYYRGLDRSDCFPFSYASVRTAEGCNGVLHVVYFGCYIPQKWLYDNWKDILGVPYLANQSVDVRACKKTINDSMKLASYVVNQYVANQSALVYSSCSWSWVFRGFIGVWTEHLKSVKRSLFYNPVQNKYYRRREEVSFFSEVYRLWDKYYSCCLSSLPVLDQTCLSLEFG